MDTDKHTGRTLCEDEGRDCGDASEAKEHQRLPANHQKLGERNGKDSFSQTSEETNPANTLILDFSFQNWETTNLCCLTNSFVLLCYGSPSKLIHRLRLPP